MSQSTQKTPSQPQPCKMGCGFFGSNATGDCCSKCYNDSQATQKKDDAIMGTAAPANESASVPPVPVPMETPATPSETESTAMEVEAVVDTAPSKAPASPVAPEEKKAVSPASPVAPEEKAGSPVAAVAETPTKKKKKKKKLGYKNMMATMMVDGSQPKDGGKDDESLRKHVGGGDFSKVDKI